MKFELDPYTMFKGASTAELFYWSQFIIKQSQEAEELEISLIDVINNHYGYPTHEFKGGTMDDRGVYSYPEDPDLYPICKIDLPKETVFMYEYEMVGIINKETGEKYVTRVD